MSTTTVGDLLDRAETLARVLRIDPAQITTDQWRSFDSTTYRLLAELLGPERTSTRAEILNHVSVTRIVNAYPSPLTTPSSETTYNAKQAAGHLGVSQSTIVNDIRRARLPATYDGRRYSIKATDLSPTPDFQPADPESTRTLDRLSCTLGVLADMVVAERSRPTSVPGLDPLRDDAQVAPVMARVLAMTVVAARHTLVNIPLPEADRPLLIAQYAARSLDALGDVGRPSELNAVASFAPPTSPRGPNEQLEAALRSWATHARSELARTVPSTEVLRDIANQARHLYAVSTALVMDSFTAGNLSRRDAELVHVDLREAAQVMHRVQQQWKTVTTATRPSHEYVTATTALHTSLTAIQQESLSPGNQTDSAKRTNVDQARPTFVTPQQTSVSSPTQQRSCPSPSSAPRFCSPRPGSFHPRWNVCTTATTESTSPSNSRKERTSSTPRKREPAPRSKSGQPWNSSYDLLRRLNCPGRPRPPDLQIKSSSRSRASVNLTCTEVSLRDVAGRLAPHGVPREKTRDARQASRP